MPHDTPSRLDLVTALHTAFLQIGEEAELSLDESLDLLGMFLFAELQTAYHAYEQEGYPYPQGRVFHVLGNLLHSLSHVPPSMDPRGDEWMMSREDVLYPMYDGGPPLAAIRELRAWETQAEDPTP